MKCINASEIACSILNDKRNPADLNAHISTFEDGATDVLCTAKGGQKNECSITGKPCAFIRTTTKINIMDALQGGSLDKAVETLERQLIEDALERAGGNIDGAAHALSIPYRALRYKMERLGIRPKE